MTAEGGTLETRVDSVGLMTGLGFGLMYLPAIDIIEVYFDREEETASASTSCFFIQKIALTLGRLCLGNRVTEFVK
jgi:hypothetical protein